MPFNEDEAHTKVDDKVLADGIERFGRSIGTTSGRARRIFLGEFIASG